MRGAALLAGLACALATALAAVTAGFAIVDDGAVLPAEDGGRVKAAGELTFAFMVVAFAGMGALVAARRPRNPIGWVLCLSPVCLAFTGAVRGWYLHTLFVDPGSLPLAGGLVWAANWVWAPGFLPLLTLLLVLFPDGRPVSRRWWPVAWVAAVAIALLSIGYAFAPGALEDYPRVDNPLGVESAEGVTDVMLAAGFPLFAIAAVASMASVVVRFRRARGVERQQVKWMAAAAALVVAAWLASAVLDQVFSVDASVVLPLVLLALPGAAAVAVLRYRLYDLGLVVNRTLVYGALTATLAAAYLATVLVLQAILSGGSDLAVAASTLAVAALFRPLRRRIQSLVDRRFYRRRYDAAQTLASFSARLRDEVDLASLRAELRGVVAETVQPAHVSLWLRGPEIRP